MTEYTRVFRQTLLFRKSLCHFPRPKGVDTFTKFIGMPDS